MNPDAVARAAQILVSARRHKQPIDSLPTDLRPAGQTDAEAIQDMTIELLDEPIGAWKVGAPGPQAEPSACPLPASAVKDGPAMMRASDFPPLAVEAELCFRVLHDLPPRPGAYDADTALYAFGMMRPAIEIVASRYVDWQAVDPWSRVADMINNGALVVGAFGVADWRERDLARQKVRLEIGGRAVVTQDGGNSAGDPRRLLAWLANHAAKRVGGLRAGQIVTTGSFTGINHAVAGDTALALFPGVGETQATFV